MKTQTVKKIKLNAPISRKTSGMIDEKGKSKIVEVVKSVMMSCLSASRKYGVSRNSIKALAGKINLTTFLSADIFLQPLDLTQN